MQKSSNESLENFGSGDGMGTQRNVTSSTKLPTTTNSSDEHRRWRGERQILLKNQAKLRLANKPRPPLQKDFPQPSKTNLFKPQ